MTTIWHIADIHIERKRHKAIKYAFNQLIQHIISSPGPNILVIVGDIFEFKTKYSQEDVSCFHYLLDKTQQIQNLTVIIIPGNHDFSDSYEGDLISSALINTKYSNLFHYPTSGIYTHGPVDIYAYSPIDSVIPPEPTDRTRWRVALLHEPIKGCKAYGGIELHDARFDATSLSKRYDVVLLGDIHKKQFLKPNVAYCGSFVQKTKIEDYMHGCIKWTLPSNRKGGITSEFINFDQIELRITIEMDGDALKMFPTSQIKSIRYLELSHTNSTKVGVQRAVGLIVKKFGVTPHAISGNLSKASVQLRSLDGTESITNASSQQLQIIKDILIEQNQESSFEEIKRLHLKSMQTGKKERNRWTLLYLEWSDIFCYGQSNHIDFTKFGLKDDRVFSLVGRNKTGKSSVIDIMLLILFNHLTRGTRSTIIRQGCDSFAIKCKFQIGSTVYTITRTTTSSENNTCSLHSVGPDTVEQDISGGTITETYDRMRDLIGDHKEFLNVNIAIQNGTLFADLTPSAQRIRVLQFLELDHLHELSKSIDQEVRALKRTVKGVEDSLPEAPPRKDYRSAALKCEEQLKKATQCIQDIMPKISLDRKATIYTTADLAMLTQQLNDLKIDSTGYIKTDLSELLGKLTSTKHNLQSKLSALLSFPDTESAETPAILQEQIDGMRAQLIPFNEELLIEPVPPNQDVLALQEKIKLCQQQLTQLITYQTKNTRQHWLSLLCDPSHRAGVPERADRLSQARMALAALPIVQNYVQQTTLSEQDVDAVLKNPPSGTTIIPVKIPTEPVLPQSLGIETELMAELSLLRKASIDVSLKNRFRFDAKCACCTSNSQLFMDTKDVNRRDVLEKYFNDLTEYKLLLDRYSRSVKLDIQNKSITLYNQCVNDKEYYRSLSLITSRELLTREIQQLEALEQLAFFDHNESVNRIKLKMIAEIGEHESNIATVRSYQESVKHYKTTIHNVELRRAIDETTFKLKQAQKRALQLEIVKTDASIGRAKQILHHIQLVEDIEAVRHNQKVDAAKLDHTVQLQELLVKQKEIQWQLAQNMALARALEQYDSMTQKLISLRHELDIKQLYSKCLNLNTGVPTRCLNQHLDQLEASINAILRSVTDFSVKFTRSNAKKETTFLHTISYDGNTIIPVDLSSGFQRFLIDTAIRFSLVSTNPYIPRFLIIDEGFGCMDTEHLINMREYISTIFHSLDNLDWLLLISHIEELKFANLLRIDVTSGISQLTY